MNERSEGSLLSIGASHLLNAVDLVFLCRIWEPLVIVDLHATRQCVTERFGESSHNPVALAWPTLMKYAFKTVQCCGALTLLGGQQVRAAPFDDRDDLIDG